jgi:hypothetical protein
MIDYESFQPNLKALRRILITLSAAAVATFGIAMFLILHAPPRPKITHVAQRCACRDAGICCLPPKVPARGRN